jgi:DNA-binding LytR/AlgR family response regulator
MFGRKNKESRKQVMQSDISVLVIEDEETWAHQITYDLKQFGFTVVDCIDTVEDALPAISANNFDIALLDINLNGKNSGIALGKLISQTIKKPFIFITGSVNDGIIADAAAALPSAFLTKPFNPASLFISIQGAIHHFSAGQNAGIGKDDLELNSFFVKLGNKYTRVDWQNVICLRSDKNYTSIITSDDNTYMIRSTLQKTLQHLVPAALKDNFVQINRGDVLNKAFIKEVVGDEAITEHQAFGITETYLKNLKQQLNVIS